MKLTKTITLLALSLFAVTNTSAQAVKLIKAEKIQLEQVISTAKAELELSVKQAIIQSPAQAFENLLVKQNSSTTKSEKLVKLNKVAE